MVRTVKKKSYSKRKTEDYIFKRKLKFAFSKFLRIIQFLFIIFLLSVIVWIANYGGYSKISSFTYEKSNALFISLGLKIESVEINGNKIVPTDMILNRIFISLGDITTKSIILLDLEKLRNDITSIGWVESADIRKKLPGKLIIVIKERVPQYIWQNKGQLWLADLKGNLLTQKIEKQYIYLPVIIGQNPDRDIPELVQILRSSAKLAEGFSGAVKVGNRRWDIMLKNGIRIKLPEQSAEKAWKKLEELQNKNSLFSKRINYIDMRIEGQLITGLETEQQNEILEGKKKLEKQ